MDLNFVFHPRDVRRVQVEAELAEPEHLGAQRLLAYWHSKRGLNGLVSRTAIEPREIVGLLPWLFIAEGSGPDWRFRLIGTGLCAGFGADLTGKSLQEIFQSDAAASLIHLYEAVATTNQPKTLKGRYKEAGLDHVTAEGVHLRIVARDGCTPQILGGVFFSDQKAA